MRILIFGIKYAPELTGIGPYTTGIAEHFAQQGHHVRVVTGIPHYPFWRAQSAPSHSENGLTVRRYRHFVPARPTTPGRALYELTWLASAARSLQSERVDVVIGIVPSLSGAALGWAAGARQRARVGIVFQDLMGLSAGQSGYRGGGKVAGLVQAIEKFLARRASAVAVISDGFRRYLERAGVESHRIVRVRNWARYDEPRESREATREALGWRPDEFVCLHAGNMGQKQGLDNLLDTAKLLEGSRLRIVLVGDGNDRPRLTKRAAELQLRSLTFAPLQQDSRFSAVISAADALLVNQRDTVDDMALPSKLGAYFAAGRPVVAAAATASDTASEIQQSQAGVVVPAADPRALASALVSLREDPSRASALGAHGRMYAAAHLTPECALAGFDRFLALLHGSRDR